MSTLSNGLKNKVAIVTGGSRGIGKAIVEELIAQGALVSFNYVQSKELAEDLVNSVNQKGGKAMAVQCDVRNLDDAKKFVDETKARFGRVDFLVNNAGILRDKTLMMMSEAEWKDVMDTNINGIFNLTKQVILGFLKEKSGVVVNISSTAGLIGNAGQVNYSTSKAGIIGFTKALAKEASPYGVRVNAVAPGFIGTDMVRNIPANKMEDALKSVPMKRVGAPEEVAKVVVFLLSDAASYITGHVIPIDGGLAI